MKLNLSQHAKMRQIDRGVSDEEIRGTVATGAKIQQQHKIRAERGIWAVVFRKSKDVADKFFIITITYRWEKGDEL